MSTISEPHRNPWNDQSLWLLFLSNIITIYFAITEGWDIGTLMLIYWFQSVTIGIFNFIRILSLKEFSTKGMKVNGRRPEATKGTKYGTAFFFLFHYGFFHLLYIVFIMQVNPPYAEMRYIYLLSLLFFLNHLFSYFYNRPKDSKDTNIGSLMFYPYIRIIPMHLTMFASSSLQVFLILKMLADVMMHKVEHGVSRKKSEK